MGSNIKIVQFIIVNLVTIFWIVAIFKHSSEWFGAGAVLILTLAALSAVFYNE